MTDEKPAPTTPAGPVVSQADEMTVCDNCSACRAEGDLNYITDYHQRVEPGGMVPSGECPDCGALCYPEDATKPEIVTVVRTGVESAYVHGDSKAAVEAALERIPHKARSDGWDIRSGGWLVPVVVSPGESLMPGRRGGEVPVNRYVSLYYELRDGTARWVAVDAPSAREAEKATGLHRQHDLHVETWRIDHLAERVASALNEMPPGPDRPYVVIYQDFDLELRFNPTRAALKLSAAEQFEDEGLIVEVVYAEDLKSQVERFQSATPEEIAKELAFDQGVAAQRLLEAREPMSLGSLIRRLPSLER